MSGNSRDLRVWKEAPALAVSRALTSHGGPAVC